MVVRRTILAFAVTFVCALAVFTLPRIVWNTVQGAVPHQRPTATDSASRSPAPAAAPLPQAAPRSIPQRLTGIFGIALILGIGFALSRNRRAISWQIVGGGVGLQFAFPVFVLRVSFAHRPFQALVADA